MVPSVKNTVIVILLLLPGMALKSNGQSYAGGAGMVNAGYMWTPALPSSLHSLTDDSVRFSKGYTLIGAEVNYRKGPALVALSGYIGMQEARSVGNRLVEPFTWKAHANFGWMLYSDRSLFLYPSIGAGAMGSSLTWYSRSATSMRTVSAVAPSMDAGLHADFLLNDAGEPNTISIAMISFAAGYTRSLFASKWYGDTGEEKGDIAPRHLHGWYLTVSVGGFAFMKK